MTDEFTKISFCVFMNHEKKKMQSGEKKNLKFIDPCLKKRKKKKNLAPFLQCRRRSQRVDLRHRSLASSVVTHSHFPISQSNFFRVVFVYLRKRNNRVFYSLRKKKKRQIRVILSPKKKKAHKNLSVVSKPCLRCVQPCPSRIQIL